MLLGHEATEFAKKKKPLRVTAPAGDQISSYRLQLPYLYILPMMTAMTVLHWLISRSYFLLQIVDYNVDGSIRPGYSTNVRAFQAAPIMLAIIIGGLLILAPIICAFRPLSRGMPNIRSCSIAISAACHVDRREKNVPLKYLMYGVIPANGKDEDGREYVGFSRNAVQPLVAGEVYTSVRGRRR